MPQLEWHEVDVLRCLEVLPEVEELGTSYCYDVRQSDLILSVAIWPYESIVTVSLSQREAKLASWTLAVRGFVRRVLDKMGERLEFRDCVVISNRFDYLNGTNPFDATISPHGLTMQLSTKPHLNIAFV